MLRNRLVKVTALLVLASVAILGGLIAVYSAKAEPVVDVRQQAVIAPPVTHPVASEVYVLVNQERIKAGLQPLAEDSRLDASASAKCADEDTKNYHAHVAPDGTSWASFIIPHYGPNYGHIGENLSWNYKTSAAAVNGWMGSPGHKKNILDATFTNVGYAVCGVDNWNSELVQHFEG